MRRLLVAVLAACAAACGVKEREALVGRYTVSGRAGEEWVLADDGTCRIHRAGASQACEWELREDASGTRLRVTLQAGGGSPRTYVLAPSRWPGRPVTIPLDASATLVKID
jgi:hypothetical protein